MSILARLTGRRARRTRRRCGEPCWTCHGTGRVWNPPVGAIICPICPPTAARPVRLRAG
ncbi:hypothetical protein ACRB68_53440 [Actinomadura sp. RB68]|uniref:Uncharacterized protein n=1 Tax=Actinomadura macrotermitis TaxID=2585200 RepID=A0A7K0C346_9ACTN|nr:hypothetical protein [Actinomadura macrotermitis]